MLSSFLLRRRQIADINYKKIYASLRRGSHGENWIKSKKSRNDKRERREKMSEMDVWAFVIAGLGVKPSERGVKTFIWIHEGYTYILKDRRGCALGIHKEQRQEFLDINSLSPSCVPIVPLCIHTLSGREMVTARQMDGFYIVLANNKQEIKEVDIKYLLLRAKMKLKNTNWWITIFFTMECIRKVIIYCHLSWIVTHVVLLLAHTQITQRHFYIVPAAVCVTHDVFAATFYFSGEINVDINPREFIFAVTGTLTSNSSTMLNTPALVSSNLTSI